LGAGGPTNKNTTAIATTAAVMMKVGAATDQLEVTLFVTYRHDMPEIGARA
jgi:hypothetical protein